MDRTINEVIVHCSYTLTDMDIGFVEINRWHTRKGWKSESGIACGYHRIIRRDGETEWGRPLKDYGAGVKGHNIYTIHICLIGGMGDDGKPDCNFTFHQYATLENELKWMQFQFGDDIKISGHRDYSDKECPTFDALAFAEGV